uniref:KIAA1045 RING finger domain-containing protein n=1 Tax=Octopus bimaculoides TaxID=37653 RepID=A0A0L8GLC8_OCTBM
MGGSSTKLTRSFSSRERHFNRKSSRHRRTKSDMPTTDQFLTCPDYIRPASRGSSNLTKIERLRNADLPNEPNNIPYFPAKRGSADVVCSYCGVYTGNENHPCKVCDLVFHKICLNKYYVETCNDTLLDMDPCQINEESWTCHNCEDLLALLTIEEYNSLMRMFEKFGMQKDTLVTHANFLRFRRGVYNNIHGEDMKPDEMKKSMQHFEHMDVNDKGEITRKDFINSEVIRILKQRPEHKITCLLKPKEIEEVRAIFRSIDSLGQGSAKKNAVQGAFIKWLAKRKKISVSKSKSRKCSLDEKRDKEYIRKRSLPGDNSKTIIWQDFVSQYALAVIAARPNTYGYIYTDEYIHLLSNC